MNKDPPWISIKRETKRIVRRLNLRNFYVILFFIIIIPYIYLKSNMIKGSLLFKLMGNKVHLPLT